MVSKMNPRNLLGELKDLYTTLLAPRTPSKDSSNYCELSVNFWGERSIKYVRRSEKGVLVEKSYDLEQLMRKFSSKMRYSVIDGMSKDYNPLIGRRTAIQIAHLLIQLHRETDRLVDKKPFFSRLVIQVILCVRRFFSSLFWSSEIQLLQKTIDRLLSFTQVALVDAFGSAGFRDAPSSKMEKPWVVLEIIIHEREKGKGRRQQRRYQVSERAFENRFVQQVTPKISHIFKSANATNITKPLHPEEDKKATSNVESESAPDDSAVTQAETKVDYTRLDSVASFAMRAPTEAELRSLFGSKRGQEGLPLGIVPPISPRRRRVSVISEGSVPKTDALESVATENKKQEDPIPPSD